MKNKKGFTLAELLVVVAIIAVLVAVSIPIFTAKLDSAKEATDNANLRAAKAAAISEFLAGDAALTSDGWYMCYYDADKGVATVDQSGIKGYNKKPVQLKYEPNTPTVDSDEAMIRIDMNDGGSSGIETRVYWVNASI